MNREAAGDSTESTEIGQVKLAIAAVICTHNRASLLGKALRSLQEQTLAPEDFEIVVVDNASTDDTRRVVEGFLGPPTMRYCFEENLGVSYARNRALQETQAPIIAYIDDDARAAPGWLAAIVAAFTSESRRPLCVGGRVLPLWETRRPAWLPDPALFALGLLDYGDARRKLKFPKEHLYCLNLAFERSYLLQIGGFNTSLGRKGGKLLGNEETALLRRVSEDRGRIIYEPRALVHHWVPRERTTLRWFLRRLFAQGVSDVVEAPSGPPTGSAARIGGRLRALIRKRSRTAGAVLLMGIAYDLGRLSERIRRQAGRGQTLK